MIPDHVAAFIAAVSRQFNPPRLDETEAAGWMRDYVRVIGKYDADVLSRAAHKIIETRTESRFPKPAECRAACVEADRDLATLRKDQGLLSHGQRDQSPWASWRQDMADTLIKTDMGRQAAREGWVLLLWNYCRDHGRLPSPDMAARFAREARAIDDLIQENEGRIDGLSQACARFGRTILERRDEMQAYVAGTGEAKWRD